ncbi:MAG: universal stress protein [Ornithinimicrobium sp.]
MAKSDGPVVVGYDGSPDADWALDWAAREAAHRHRDLVILFAIDMSGLYRPKVATGRHGNYPQEMADAIVAGGIARARKAAPGVSVSSKTTIVGAAAALTGASVKASLLVVGGRGRSRLAEALLGTVQFAVTAHAECSVVVVPPGCDVVADAEHAVVVGVDGSEGSTHAARAAAETAASRGAVLKMVGAWEKPPADEWSRYYIIDDALRQEIYAAARANAAQHVKKAAQSIKEEYADVDVRDVVTEGRPSRVLTTESEEAGLVVVGARGGGDMASLMLGSVGRNLIHSTRCPVAIIHSHCSRHDQR